MLTAPHLGLLFSLPPLTLLHPLPVSSWTPPTFPWEACFSPLLLFPRGPPSLSVCPSLGPAGSLCLCLFCFLPHPCLLRLLLPLRVSASFHFSVHLSHPSCPPFPLSPSLCLFWGSLSPYVRIPKCMSSRLPPLLSPGTPTEAQSPHLSPGASPALIPSKVDPLDGLANRGASLPPLTHWHPHLSGDFLSLTFPNPPPASLYANPKGRGDICLAPAPHFLSPWGSGGEWWGWSHTRTTQTCGGHSCSRLCPADPNHLETQVAEGTPDMPLCLSPSRLEGPHFSCLVSPGPGAGKGGRTHMALCDLPASVSLSAPSCHFVSPTLP